MHSLAVQRTLGGVLAVFGIALIVVASQWSKIRPVSAYWSTDKAAEYTEAQTGLHELMHNQPSSKNAADVAAFAKAKERFNKISSELAAAQSSRESSHAAFLISGI